MTKKHFEEAARIVAAMADGYTEQERREVFRRFAQLFTRFNQRFDHDRFETACKLGTGL
jgi:hypothetical protein